MNNNNVLTAAITEQQLHNKMLKYINSEIDEIELNSIMCHYIGI